VTAQRAKKSNRLRCDGTLIDSVDLHPRAWQKAFSEVGKQIPYAKLRAQIGKGADLLVPYFVNQEELERFGKKISKRQEQIFKKIYSSQISPLPPFPNCLKLAKGRLDGGVGLLRKAPGG
jgi:beta-phosphoglucomutase-like phosphatase (HAD superfamily)